MAQRWHIGCSGFHYKEWKPEFYPAGLPQTKWFEFYATRFNTLELNVTFYRFPSLKSLVAWYDKAPAGFSFSAKVPRLITHFKKMDDTKSMVDDFYAVLREGLREKLGCVLFQLPPQFEFSEANQEKLITQADRSFNNVIEFRNESWWKASVRKTFGAAGITISGVSFPRIVHDDAIVNNTIAYYRFHGVPRLFYSEYSEAFIQKIHQQLIKKRMAKEVFVYFNNTASLAALHNAVYLQQLLNV